MSLALPNSGLTVQQIISGLGELAELGLGAVGLPDLEVLVPLLVKLAEDGAALIEGQPNVAQELTTEVDVEQASGDAAEDAKLGGLTGQGSGGS